MDTLGALTGANEADLTAVIDTFREPSRAFLMPPIGDTLRPDTVIDISHESLMRAWARVGQWATEEGQSAQMYRRLAETAGLHASDQASLWRDPDLQLALNWSRDNQPDAGWAERYRPGFDVAMDFLAKSADARDAERRTAWRRKRYPLALLLVLIAVVGAWTIKAVRDRERTAQTEAILQVERQGRAKALAEKAVAEKRTRELLAQFGWDDQSLTKADSDQYAVRQSLNANQVLQQAAPRGGRDRRRAVTVEYYPKDVDQNKVESALTELGFTLSTPPAIVRNIPTNSIWYGAPVNVEDVKLVALTLIRAGVQIRAIQCLVNKRHLALIQVGADSSVVNDLALTVEGMQRSSSSFRLSGC